MDGRRAGRIALVALLLAGAAAPALAQTAPAAPPPAGGKTVSEVEVRAKPAEPGAVVGDIAPEVQLSPEDIQTYGVSTLTQLLAEISPQTTSQRGRGGERPVILLNGRRISGFNEIRDIPVEAIQRVDILPEEVALKYGYAANQRVVNIVLKTSFRAWTAEGGASAPTEGGQVSGQGELVLMHIDKGQRTNLDLKVQGATALTEDERDLVQAPTPFDPLGNVTAPVAGGEIDPALSALAGRTVTMAGAPAVTGRPSTLADFAAPPNTSDLGRYRTLLPASRQVDANGVWTRDLFAGIGATFNATLGATHTEALLGLPNLSLLVPAGDPFSPFATTVVVDRAIASAEALSQTADGWTAHLGGTFNRDIGRWRLSLTSAYDHADSLTHTDRGFDASALQARLSADDPTFNPFAAVPLSLLATRPEDKSRSISDGLEVHFLANGPSLTLPAGQLFTSIKLGDTQSWYDSKSLRLGLPQQADLSRNDLNALASVDLPLASRRNNVLAVIGDLSLNANAAVDQLSDFGTLTTLGYGLNWSPLTGLSLIVSHTREAAAPSFQQLGAPVLATPGSRVFDYVTGKTVDVVRVDGGNPFLSGDHRDVLKLGLNWRPISDQDLTFTANYVRSRLTDAVATFPALTADIQRAFPERFLRNAAGDLVQADFRPVNFASEETDSLRWGFNYARPLGAPPPRPGAFGGGRPGGGGGFRGPPPGVGGGGGGPGGGGGFGGGGGGFPGAPGRGPPGRLQFAIYHTVYFKDQTLVRAGGPLLDMLNGAAAGSNGGQPRHEVEVQGGVLWRGLGARVSGSWRSSTFVRGEPGSALGDLQFSSLAKLDLRLFEDFASRPDLVARHPWLRGARASLAVTNLFDTRQHVHDATGATPASYQPAYLDPAGRTISINFRKLFQ